MMDKVKMMESYPIILENFGLAALSDILDDRVIYRSLEPVDRQFPGLKRARYQLGLNDQAIPRKVEPAYAKIAHWMLEEAQNRKSASFEELIVIGDTLSGDGESFQNICEHGDLNGTAFIGNEEADEDSHVRKDVDTGIYVANRWSDIADWLDWSLEQGLKLDKNTVVILDIDKSAIGARGRNDRAIDAARLKGLYRTVDSVLGDNFDATLFETHYDELNQPEFHRVTEDNQDYLAYICLILNTGMIEFEDLIKRMKNGSLDSFRQFVRWVETLIVQGGGSEAMRQVHQSVIMSVRQGDPTPFKRFRRNEFLSTLEHMNNVPDSASMEERLAREITITREVYEAGLWLRKRGCLVMSLSDKPDEASCPDRYNRDKEPIHRAETHCVGTSIQDRLDALT